MVHSTTFHSLYVTWDEVPCQDRNVDITDYQLRIILISYHTMSMGLRVDRYTRSINFTDLIPRNNYTIELRALHLNSYGTFVTSLSGPPSLIAAKTAVPPGS